MKTEDLYKKKKDCCGCELCAQSCPKQIVQMRSDEVGFLYPYIEDDSSCINCRKCINVCPIKSHGREKVEIQKSFGFSLPEEADLKRSASGGLATAISRAFVQKGGVVYGVAYTDGFQTIRFLRADTKEEIEQFRGSKYVQAIKGDVYAKVQNDLKEGRDVLYIGLPCEISALYHAVRTPEHLYTISLICHGPTTQKVHRDYCESIPNRGASPISFFSVRYKLKGWKPYYIHVEFSDGAEYNEQWNQSDYGTAFLYLKRPSCRTCRYKAEDSEFGLQSDMTIGDFHGVDRNSSQFNPWGVSQGSIQTEKGCYLTSLIDVDIYKNPIQYSHIKNTNRGLFVAIPQRGNIRRFVADYLNHSLHYACNSSMVRRTNRMIIIQFKLSRIIRGLKTPSKVIDKLKSKLVKSK